MVSDKKIKNDMSKVKKLYNIEIDRKNVHIHGNDFRSYIGISKNAINDISETPQTVNIRTKPTHVDISLWKNVPHTHISIHKIEKVI